MANTVSNAIDIRMPHGCSARTGTLHRCAVTDGRRVLPGDLVAEVEVDKAIIDMTSPIQGCVSCLATDAEGTEMPVGVSIARIRA
jgi:pyruvate/2-oxoglutarate dehydrogenase complex dihydrolipoamide acyltransferase (E2) component